MKKTVILILIASMFLFQACAGGQVKSGGSASTPSIQLALAGTYSNGQFDESAAEIVTYDPDSKRAFVVNAHKAVIDVFDLSNGEDPIFLKSIDCTPYGAGVNSVDFCNGVLAAAVEADPKQKPGQVVFFDYDGNFKAKYQVGALPDMVCFSPNGQFILTANEGEPNGDYSVDPEGSISIIDISFGLENAKVMTADFLGFNAKAVELRSAGVRISHPGSTVAQDVEPEYIAVSGDSQFAYVSLQENNALAVVAVPNGEVAAILPLKLKDWAGGGWTLDASDKDEKINMQTWPVFGCYMPDAIAAYEVGGKTYIITANEGDSREYDGYADEKRLAKARLDAKAFPNADELQDKKNLGRLKVIPDLCDVDNDGDFDRIVAFGARSFSIWDAKGKLVYDSGDEFEKILAGTVPEMFNASNDENAFDDRSDDKGAEPEAVAVGEISGQWFAFIGLERVGGIMVYNVTDPASPQFIQYFNNRNWGGDPKVGTAGDLGPEGFKFVPADKSPNGVPLLLVANEISGSTSVYEIIVK